MKRIDWDQVKTPRTLKYYHARHLEFLEYFAQFYGPEGIYPETIPGYKDSEVIFGIVSRGVNFEGDTFDREYIRDAILHARGQLRKRS